MRLLSRRLGVALALVALLAVHGHLRGAASAQEPVVYGVLIYDPTCPNCEVVHHEVLPPLEAEYGDRFVIVPVDASTVNGFDIWTAGTKAYDVPNEKKGVPLLFIGDRALSGEFEIAEELPDLVQAGVAAGGIPLPADLPLTEADIPTWAAHYASDATQEQKSDPLASGLATLVLAGTFVGLVVVGVGVPRARPVTVAGISERARVDRSWAIPVLSAAGLLVAGYLSYLHLSSSEAICPVGNCDAVQHSPWAKLFGVPVAYLGFLTYGALLGLWAWGRLGRGERARRSNALVLGIAAFGTAFSAYLTLLELLVIRAVCIWCLVSAVIMTLILVAAAVPLYRSAHAPASGPKAKSRREAGRRAAPSDAVPVPSGAAVADRAAPKRRRRKKGK